VKKVEEEGIRGRRRKKKEREKKDMVTVRREVR